MVGHVLVIPKRVVPFFKDLHREEVNELYETIQIVAKGLSKYYKEDSFDYMV